VCGRECAEKALGQRAPRIAPSWGQKLVVLELSVAVQVVQRPLKRDRLEGPCADVERDRRIHRLEVEEPSRPAEGPQVRGQCLGHERAPAEKDIAHARLKRRERDPAGDLADALVTGLL
jgi:hypothetical protein